MTRTLVLGGTRSGKSRFAESLLPTDSSARYLATGAANPGDVEWTERLTKHRNRRPAHWITTETPDVAQVLRADEQVPTLVDDLGGWLTSTMDAHNAWADQAESIVDQVNELLTAITSFAKPLTLVSPEVGLCVVPANAAARLFADELGALNQAVADRCHRVVLVVAGQPLTIKDAP